MEVMQLGTMNCQLQRRWPSRRKEDFVNIWLILWAAPQHMAIERLKGLRATALWRCACVVVPPFGRRSCWLH